MPRATTTSDVFNAIAEPRRRQIIDVLARGEGQLVGSLVDSLGIPQSAVSKHLKVLREVGIVLVGHGALQVDPLAIHAALHDVDALLACSQELKSVHDWVKPFERYWTHQISRIKQRAEAKVRERSTSDNKQRKP